MKDGRRIPHRDYLMAPKPHNMSMSFGLARNIDRSYGAAGCYHCLVSVVLLAWGT